MTNVSPIIRARASETTAALIGYLPVGFPDVRRSIDAARALVDEGVDIIELGFPYTDPGMDGEVIQKAAFAALDGGVKLRDVFTAVEAVASTGAGVVVMTYYNPVYRYGVSRFAADLAQAGGAGLITPDLIPEEAGEWVAAADEHNLDKIFLVAPSSRDERLKLTIDACRGFVYVASTMGVTGARSEVDSRAKELVARCRTFARPETNLCVGLGVSNGAQARDIAGFADGVIVGSALVRCLSTNESERDQLTNLRALARDLAQGAHGA